MEDLFTRLERTLNPELPSLTESQQQLLQELTIDENQPSAILHDFQILIGRMKATIKYFLPHFPL